VVVQIIFLLTTRYHIMVCLLSPVETVVQIIFLLNTLFLLFQNFFSKCLYLIPFLAKDSLLSCFCAP